MKLTLAALAFLILAGPALADSLTLVNGGTIEGPIDSIVFRQADEKTTYGRTDVASISLKAANGLDIIVLTNGFSKSGELVSLSTRTIAGVLSFGRERLIKVEMKDGPLQKLLAEFKRRRAGIKDDDAAGLSKLAVWCRTNALTAEARATAKECLKLKLDDDTAATVHGILGHVLKDGKWIKPPRPTVEPIAKPQPTTTANVEPSNSERAVLLKAVIAEYTVWAAEAKQAEQVRWKTYYEPLWESAQFKVANAKAAVSDSAAEKDRLAEAVRVEREKCKTNKCPLIRKRADALQRELNAARSNHALLERAYTRAKARRPLLVSRMRAARSRIRSRAESRTSRISLAKSKITRLLRLGHKLTESDMRKIATDLTGRS